MSIKYSSADIGKIRSEMGCSVSEAKVLIKQHQISLMIIDLEGDADQMTGYVGHMITKVSHILKELNDE